MKSNSLCPTEAQEQRNLFRWAAYNRMKWPELALMHHVPNGGSRDPREAHNLKEQGVKRGVPDICLPVSRRGFNGLYIELKRVKGGRVSEEQRWWLAQLTKQGYYAVVCRGWEDASVTITAYLKGAKRDD